MRNILFNEFNYYDCFFSAHVDTMEQTASESTLQETSICARMVT
jgi:hypothetical protein